MPVPFEQLNPEWQQYITRLVEDNASLSKVNNVFVGMSIIFLLAFVCLTVVYLMNRDRVSDRENKLEARRSSYAAVLDMVVFGGRVDADGLQKIIAERYATDACLVDDILLFSMSNNPIPNSVDKRRRRIFKDVADGQGAAFRLTFSDDGRILCVGEMLHGGFIVWRNKLPAEKLGFNMFSEE